MTLICFGFLSWASAPPAHRLTAFAHAQHWALQRAVVVCALHWAAARLAQVQSQVSSPGRHAPRTGAAANRKAAALADSALLHLPRLRPPARGLIAVFAVDARRSASPAATAAAAAEVMA